MSLFELFQSLGAALAHPNPIVSTNAIATAVGLVFIAVGYLAIRADESRRKHIEPWFMGICLILIGLGSILFPSALLSITIYMSAVSLAGVVILSLLPSKDTI
jgi:uncharacterized membrane protein HdeD (DUF308 family)